MNITTRLRILCLLVYDRFYAEKFLRVRKPKLNITINEK